MSKWKWIAGILTVVVVALGTEFWLANRKLDRIKFGRLSD